MVIFYFDKAPILHDIDTLEIGQIQYFNIIYYIITTS